MTQSTRNIDDVIQEAIARTSNESDDDIDIDYEALAKACDENPSEPVVENEIELTVVEEPTQSSQPNIIHATPHKDDTKKKADHAIPPPEIDINLLHVNASYKLVVVLVDELYSSVRQLFDERPTKDQLLLQSMKIVGMTINAVENLKKTGKALKGIEKKELAIAVINGIFLRFLYGNKDILSLYELLIKPRIGDMIESIIETTRQVNRSEDQGNNGNGREGNPKKQSCWCFSF
jgi:hypothetical protein